MTTTDDSVPPIVCTLSDEERSVRRLEWGDLGALALTTKRIEGGVLSTFPLGRAEEVEDLASRESSCCGSWLEISTTRTAVAVELDVTTSNPDGLEMIMSMVGLSEP